MKRNLLFILLPFLFHSAFAQDIILKLNGDELPARVLEITLDAVVYQHPDSGALTLRIPRQEVFMVRFENGTRELLANNQPENSAVAGKVLTPEKLHQLGAQDALKYYKGNGVKWGAAASTALVFPYGLAGAAIIGLTPPQVQPGLVSHPSLLASPEYVRGYEAQAKKKKRRKAAAGAGIGAAAAVTVISVAVLVALNGFH